MNLPPQYVKIQEQIEKYALDYGLDFFETIFETRSDPSAVYRLVIIVWYLPGWNRVP